MDNRFEWVLQDIRNGVTYPDFWQNRYGEGDAPEEECTYTRWWEEEQQQPQSTDGKSAEKGKR